MAINRRAFLKGMAADGAAGAAAVVTIGATGEAVAGGGFQRTPFEMPADAVGLLYDSTLCIGCRACQAACKEANGMAAEVPTPYQDWNEGLWDSPTDLSGDTLTVIQVYQDGNMAVKDRAEDGYAFMKRQCMHCTDASCVSVCPVTAMTKDPVTGVVIHHEDRCIGCRYCVLSCPFGVPRYQYDDPFGAITKCQLCTNVPDQEYSACAMVCPTGATLYGRVDDLKAEARLRLAKDPGAEHAYPRGRIGGDNEPNVAPIPVYQDDFYGDNILGGTQCLTLAGVPYDRLGLPLEAPDFSYATLTEGIQHTLYRYMILPAVVLGGLVTLAWRNSRRHKPEDWD
ncbi:MAG: hydrogenase 2 operon protein HybA [Alphaproteobacteria bacterium]|jgi:Fe-S-cluster-containing dehydrogenase component|nr:hydrogenase 2 operon protein HybA [Alphaproteobacteria bacterium]